MAAKRQTEENLAIDQANKPRQQEFHTYQCVYCNNMHSLLPIKCYVYFPYKAFLLFIFFYLILFNYFQVLNIKSSLLQLDINIKGKPGKVN